MLLWIQKVVQGRPGRDLMEGRFTTTCAISVYHLDRCEFESCSWWGVLETTLCDKVCQWLAKGLWFSPGTPVYFIIKTDCHDITEILLKVALNTINPMNILFHNYVFVISSKSELHIINKNIPFSVYKLITF